MYFHKIDHPLNFKYADPGELQAETTPLGEDVFRLSIRDKRWKESWSRAELSLAFEPAGAGGRFEFGPAGLDVSRAAGNLLKSRPGFEFGMLGRRWIMCFEYDQAMRFYGMGEKHNGFEKTGLRTKFWNTDVWADFSRGECVDGRPDPSYASIPYLLMRAPAGWLGILVNNPFAVFMAAGVPDSLSGSGGPAGARRFFLGSSDGEPELFFILGGSAREVTRKLQRLVGVTPRPPAWALGYHQSRWGYKSFADLDALDKRFEAEKLPCDGLWLDIDYMDGYRVFSFDEKNFSSPKNQFAELARHGRRVVPILDPGVKLDEGFDLYADGLKKGVFCRTSEGKPFVGLVWPGETVFPDFSLEEARAWWAELVKKFADAGAAGAWLDMNDPAVGWVELDEMRFGKGKLPHETFHNQYGLLMQMASRAGFLASRPGLRPFLLSRSAFISSGRFAALWTGDNWSNWHHLKQSIPVSLNLSLSGLPWNGPDVPGFGGDADPELAAAWFKTAFLFPFLRNHCHRDGRPQEPWAFPEKEKKIIGEFIRLRYKLLPYLYNLFIDQEELGEPVLRPLFYDFADTERLALDRLEDQFLIGPAVLQAPLLEAGAKKRRVSLPGPGLRWFSPAGRSWLDGNQIVEAAPGPSATPIYFREDVMLPMLRGERVSPDKDFDQIELHVFLSPGSAAAARCRYRFDDGESFSYRKGLTSSFEAEAVWQGRQLELRVTRADMGFKPCTLSLVVYGRCESVRVTGAGPDRSFKPVKVKLSLAGTQLVAVETERFKIPS